MPFELITTTTPPFIKQTDPSDLSGLSAITGVTVTTEGGITYYNIGNLILRYANLTIPYNQTLVLPSNSPNNAFRPDTATSSLTIGSDIQNGGERIWGDWKAIIVQKQPANVHDIFQLEQASIRLDQGSINWWFGTIQSNMVIYLGVNGNIYEGAVIENYPVLPPYTAESTQVRPDNINLVIDGLKVRGQVSTILVSIGNPNFTTIPRLILERANGITPGAGGWNTLKNYSSRGNNKDLNIQGDNLLRGINVEKGSETIIVEHNTLDAHTRGVVEIRKEWEVTLRDPDGDLLEGANYFIRDTDNGDRRNAFGQTYTDDFTYSGSSGANGKTGVVDVLTAVVANATGGNGNVDDTGLMKKDRRSKNDDTEDEFDIYFYHYNQISSQTTQKLKGVEVLEFDWTLFDDTNISETNKATVDAYTTIDNLDQLYDRAKSWKIDAANVEVPTISNLLFVGNGSELLLHQDWSLVIDNTATDVIAVNSTTKVITIKTAGLDEGAKFNTLKAQGTGTITAAKIEPINVGYIDAIGDSYLVFTDNWEVYTSVADRNASTNVEGSGSSSEIFRFNYSENTTYYMWVGGTKKQVTPSQSGETAVDLSTTALLVGVKEKTDALLLTDGKVTINDTQNKIIIDARDEAIIAANNTQKK